MREMAQALSSVATDIASGSVISEATILLWLCFPHKLGQARSQLTLMHSVAALHQPVEIMLAFPSQCLSIHAFGDLQCDITVYCLPVQINRPFQQDDCCDASKDQLMVRY